MAEWFKKRLESLLDNAIFAVIIAGCVAVIAAIKLLPLPVIIGIFVVILIIIMVAIRLIVTLGKRRHIIKTPQKEKQLTKRGQTVNETKALDWVTCDKCGLIAVRNIKTRELEEVEDNQRNTGQPILTRINSLGDTEPRHERFPECLVQLQDFATLPPLSSQPLPLFYMQLPRQCPQFIKWQKGLTPKEHKEIIDRQLRQQSTAYNEPEISIKIDNCSWGNSVIRNDQPVRTIKVALTLNVKNPPINVIDLELYMGDEIQKFVGASPTVPFRQENKKECYIAKYELFPATSYKVPIDKRNKYHLCVVAMGQKWPSKEFSITIPNHLLAGGKEGYQN